ncbi:hypothetical protein NLI96_g12295 [Meripilus lineatus]|uniref:Uncharacterized protein n=1 Tax=Meripilus lineatus TaxID=2056292 RepID=A0AAD5USL4_9APHY|nr:hypothetical protein NLI96_g12295 [Physisporinus lineatus]
MSLLSTETGGMIKYLWPSDVRQLPEPAEGEGDGLATTDVPKSVEEMLGWAYVGRRMDCRDRTRRYTLFYASPNTQPSGGLVRRVQVGIRTQGFVQRLNISPLGNWQGTEQTASGATQFLTIGPGNDGNFAFNAQQDALERVREFVLRLLHEEPNSRRKGGTLLFQRRVFTKFGEGISTCEMGMGDDPQGRLSRLEGKWVVKDKLAIGKLTTEGRVVRCPYISIQRGDFVEALVEVTVITAGPRRQVAFSLQQVVKLQEGKRERKRVESKVNCAPTQVIPGYKFDDDDADIGGET